MTYHIPWKNYITSFIIGMVPLLFIDIDITDASSLPQSFFIVGIILSVILATLFTLLYFRDRKIKRNAKEGFYFGLVLIAIGFTFDLAIFTISGLATGYETDIFSYYSNPLFWVATVLFVATTTTVGWIKGRK